MSWLCIFLIGRQLLIRQRDQKQRDSTDTLFHHSHDVVLVFLFIRLQPINLPSGPLLFTVLIKRLLLLLLGRVLVSTSRARIQ